MDSALRKFVQDRAGNRCEYCGIRQQDDPYIRFQLEHIVPRQHGGNDDPSNLAPACSSCNLHKGPILSAIDPDSSQIVLLFDPRRQVWSDHFVVQGIMTRRITPVGRATAKLLGMNAFNRLKVRWALQRH